MAETSPGPTAREGQELIDAGLGTAAAATVPTAYDGPITAMAWHAVRFVLDGVDKGRAIIRPSCELMRSVRNVVVVSLKC